MGSVILLSAGATEAAFRERLPQRKRWRAIHFACHGLIDAKRPMLSCLAVTAAPPDDGFLTAAEIFELETPADLVVLSACETGRGKAWYGEGVVGLTQAFLFAGAPRVLCSLWKVDDEATSALMTKFYALWNPTDTAKGLTAAAALKAAQAHIRAQPRWSDPRYWAAWVLWGRHD